MPNWSQTLSKSRVLQLICSKLVKIELTKCEVTKPVHYQIFYRIGSLPAQVLEALDLLEPRDRMQQLNPHRAKDRSPVEEEEVAPGPGMLNGVLDEVDDRVALELGEAAKAEVA